MTICERCGLANELIDEISASETRLRAMEAQVDEWANSETGRAQLIATQDSARRSAARLTAAIRVPPEMMMQKIGVRAPAVSE